MEAYGPFKYSPFLMSSDTRSRTQCASVHGHLCRAPSLSDWQCRVFSLNCTEQPTDSTGSVKQQLQLCLKRGSWQRPPWWRGVSAHPVLSFALSSSLQGGQEWWWPSTSAWRHQCRGGRQVAERVCYSCCAPHPQPLCLLHMDKQHSAGTTFTLSAALITVLKKKVNRLS